MSTLSLRLPESLHELAREVAREEDISINQLITLALAEKLSALKTDEYFKQRGAGVYGSAGGPRLTAGEAKIQELAAGTAREQRKAKAR